VQVSDSTTIGAAPVAPKDESADGDGDATRRRPRSSARFRDALKRGSGNAESAGEAAGAAAGGPGWLRPEPLRVGTPPASTAPVAAGKLAANLARIDRLLVGSAGNEAEARIRIGSGALAGAEIKLTSTGAQSVTAQLLTPGAGSRETLSVAMEEIRLRLRDKGITLGAPVARGGRGDGARRDGESEGREGSGERWPAGR
jgi:hypothetical protein